MRRVPFLALCLPAISLANGCATAPRADFALSRSTVVIHNVSERPILIVPLKGGAAYPAYRRGKRRSWLRWLGEKKILTESALAIPYGGHLRVPLVANKISYAERRMSVELLVLEKNRLIGKYFYCVTAPVYGTVEVPLVFDRAALEDLRSKNSGEPCSHQLWRY